MGLGLPIFLLLIIAVLVYIILDYYGNKKTFAWYVQITCFVSYFLAFSIIVFLPIDLSSADYRECISRNQTCQEPFAYIPDKALYYFWSISYWIMFNIQMFIVPIMMGYVRSGNLKFWRKVLDGIMENVYFYGACGLAGLILIIYSIVALKVSTDFLLTLAIPAMNAYGLALLTLLMGYGLIEFPRGLWFNSDTKWLLKYIEHSIPSHKEATIESEAELYEVARLASLASRRIPPTDQTRHIVDKILEKCPLALQDRNLAEEDEENINFTFSYLIALNARIKRAVDVNTRENAKLNVLQKKAFLCQDIIASYSNKDRKLRSAFWPVIHKAIPEDLWETVSWWWFVWVLPVTMKTVSVLCAIGSILLLWSESTFQIESPILSIPRLVFKSSHGGIEVFSFIFICYMCTCTYSSLLSLKLLDFYQMIPNQNTDEVSLLFVGAYLCKLTFPIIYNFLNMAGLAEGSTNSAYSKSPVFLQYLGPAVNLTPLLGEGYNDWMAHLILITSVVILLNLHARIFRLFNVSNFFYERFSGNEPDLEQGRQILYQARNLEERRMTRANTSANQGRARNTSELLARYGKNASVSEESINSSSLKPKTKGQYQSIQDDDQEPPNTKSTRLFGLPPNTKLPPPLQRSRDGGSGTGLNISQNQQVPKPKNQVLGLFKSNRPE